MCAASTSSHFAPASAANPIVADLTIRPATRQDRRAICPVECACFNWERLLFGLWWRVGQADTQAWIAESGEGRKPQIAGYLIAYAKLLDEKPVSYVGGVGVHPNFRKRGVGAQLMQTVMQQEPQIWLHVRARNQEAIRLYERLGFDRMKTLPRFYGNGEDAFIMARL